MYTQREVVNVGLLAAEIVDSDLGVRHSAVEPGLGVWLSSKRVEDVSPSVLRQTLSSSEIKDQHQNPSRLSDLEHFLSQSLSTRHTHHPRLQTVTGQNSPCFCSSGNISPGDAPSCLNQPFVYRRILCSTVVSRDGDGRRSCPEKKSGCAVFCPLGTC